MYLRSSSTVSGGRSLISSLLMPPASCFSLPPGCPHPSLSTFPPFSTSSKFLLWTSPSLFPPSSSTSSLMMFSLMMFSLMMFSFFLASSASPERRAANTGDLAARMLRCTRNSLEVIRKIRSHLRLILSKYWSESLG